MNTSRINHGGTRGFTLIELLVVIAIIGVLAGLLLPAGIAIKNKATKARVQAELKKVELAIESYKAKLGHYPPDNPNNIAVNPLYFELLGVKQVGSQYQTLTGNGVIDNGDLATFYGATPNAPITGFVNAGASGDDSSSSAVSYLKELLPAQYLIVENGGKRGAVLGTVVEGPLMLSEPPGGTKFINPFRYNSSSPTNNINSFDLWVDIKVGKKIFRICNWRDTPIPNP